MELREFPSTSLTKVMASPKKSDCRMIPSGRSSMLDSLSVGELLVSLMLVLKCLQKKCDVFFSLVILCDGVHEGEI